MPEQGRVHEHRWWRGTCLVAAAIVVGAVLAPTRSAAEIEVSTRLSQLRPLAWQAPDGTLHLVTDAVRFEPAGPTLVLQIAEEGPDGATSSHELVLAAPPDAIDGRPVATDGDATLTVEWTWPSCVETSLGCTSAQLARHDLDGARIGGPAPLPPGHRVLAGLDDGSVLTAPSDRSVLRWYAADGTDRDLPALGGVADQFELDGDGQLLAHLDDDRIVRASPGGSAEVLVDDACAPGVATRLGAGPGTEFAVSCTSWSPRAVQVDRYDADGEVAWSVRGDPGSPLVALGEVTALALDDQDRVWFGGTATLRPWDGPAMHAVASATAAGFGRLAYAHVQTTSGGLDGGGVVHGLADLRPIAGGGVAVADDFECCTNIAGPTFESTARAAVLPAAPAPPSCTGWASFTDATWSSASVTWSSCTVIDLVAAPTRYRLVVDDGLVATTVERSADDLTAEGRTFDPTTAPVTGGRRVTAVLTPENDAGPAPAPAALAVTVAPFRTVDAFVDQQASDVLPAWPEPARAAGADAIEAGALAPDELVARLLDDPSGPAAHDVEPLARAYRATFLRDPDLGGLRYWLRRRTDGDLRLAAITEHFASSSEFRRRYGSLSNTAFVAQVYRNVFGRELDPSGRTHWVGKLDRREITRGGLIAQLSESSEFRRRSRGAVEPLGAALLLLDRLPTATERAAWSTFLEPHRQAAAAILATEEYADRLAP